MTEDDRKELLDLALDCAFDGNGPPDMEAFEALVAFVEQLIARALVEPE